jgi:hypothetical protein
LHDPNYSIIWCRVENERETFRPLSKTKEMESKKGKGNGISWKTKGNGRIIKGNGNENEGVVSDGNENGKGNSG